MAKTRVLLLALALASPLALRAEGQGSREPDTVLVQSGSLKLQALLWQPDGRGPFPAVLFNHGSWPARDTPAGRRPDPRILAQATALGPVFARHGYVFLFLFRRGAGLSAGQGTHGGDLLDSALAAGGQEARNRIQVQLLETDELTDALAGLAFLRALPEVDSRHVAVAGHSFGGSLTLVLVERDTTLSSAVVFGGAAASWEPSPQLRARLLKAVGGTRVPVFFIHTENDYSVAPGRALAAEMARLEKPHRIKIYPPVGATPSEGHNVVHLSVATWEPDVFTFLDEGLRRGTDRRAAPDATPATTLVVADSVHHLDILAREPMVVEHPDGTLFVSGYGESAPTLWKSHDHGATWARVNVGTEASGAIGNSDVDLAVGRDGTLYFATMVFDRKALEGASISVGVSKDVGATWSWTLLSKTRFDDRPWVEVAADGTVHVIWNDGSGVSHAVSVDGGDTWTERPRIHTQGGSSHLAVGPNREVAVRVTPLSASGNKLDDGVDIVAVSTDAGSTWQKHAAPGQREWSPLLDTKATPPRWVEPLQPRWVEPLAWDAQGALYSLWTNREGLWLARSVDRGTTWTNWQVAESREVLYFPYLVARGRGELAATWFSGRGETLQAHVARLDVSDVDASPRMIESRPFRIDSWAAGARPEDPPTRDPAGEYLAMTFLSDGGLAVVSPIQNMGAQRFGFSWWRIEAR